MTEITQRFAPISWIISQWEWLPSRCNRWKMSRMTENEATQARRNKRKRRERRASLFFP